MIERIPNEWRYFDTELGIPFPWYTKPCLEVLSSMDLKGKRVFEYGVGDSTFWYLAKGCICAGVDSHEQWAQKTNSIFIPAHEKLDYVQSIYKLQLTFDIVAVDGIYRDECAANAIMALPWKNNYLVILDNFEQPSVQKDWPRTRALISEHNLNLEIYKEEQHADWQTAIIRL